MYFISSSFYFFPTVQQPSIFGGIFPTHSYGIDPEWSKPIRLIPPHFPRWLVENVIGLSQLAHGIFLITWIGSEVVQLSWSSRCCLMIMRGGSLLSIGHKIAACHHSVTMMGGQPGDAADTGEQGWDLNKQGPFFFFLNSNKVFSVISWSYWISPYWSLSYFTLSNSLLYYLI